MQIFHVNFFDITIKFSQLIALFKLKTDIVNFLIQQNIAFHL